MIDFLVTYLGVAAVLTLALKFMGVSKWQHSAAVASLWPILLPVTIAASFWVLSKFYRYGVSR